MPCGSFAPPTNWTGGTNMGKVKQNCTLGTLVVATAGLLAGLPVSAQVLEEIVVTATKRESTVQDLPMSIQALDGTTLEMLGVTDLSDLSSYVPNVNIGDGLSNTFVNVRGMGNGDDSIFEQPVSLYVDDIYMPRIESYSIALLDVERIEVLRGAQAVLFGLNSTAGAVAVHSRRNRPGDEFEANVKVSYETEFEGLAAEGAVGGSLSDSFALRLAAKTSEGDNYYENLNTGDTIGDVGFDAFRLSAVWEPGDNWNIEGKVEWAERERGGTNASLFTESNKWKPENPSESNTAGSYATIADDAVVTGDRRLPRSVDEFGWFEEQLNLSLKIEHDLASGHTVTALAGYTEMETIRSIDLLFSPTPDWAGHATKDFEKFSAELRIASPDDAAFNYIAGIYYHDTDLLNSGDNFFDLAAFGVPIGNILVHVNYDQATEVVSPFAMGTFNMADEALALF
ncbi:MAG: TonB-dependent receptor plug domain-containing protein [Gammaproteobacteria bacterium]|nr:TonB-dependent receptor plug domain-containing protein [Gammaproteobacteria bacterium]